MTKNDYDNREHMAGIQQDTWDNEVQYTNKRDPYQTN